MACTVPVEAQALLQCSAAEHTNSLMCTAHRYDTAAASRCSKSAYDAAAAFRHNLYTHKLQESGSITRKCCERLPPGSKLSGASPLMSQSLLTRSLASQLHMYTLIITKQHGCHESAAQYDNATSYSVSNSS
eukprot:9835-Heterococcus_DN1.PRE.1